MGLAYSTDQTFDYILQQHREAEVKPTLHFKFLSERDCCKVEVLFEKSREAESDRAGSAILLEAIQLALVGWDNYPESFKANEADAILSRADLIELRDNLLFDMSMSELEKKRCVLRSQSTTGKSAN